MPKIPITPDEERPWQVELASLLAALTELTQALIIKVRESK